MSAAYDELLRRWADLSDLSRAASLLGWDQETMMPPGGAALRAESQAALAGVIHERTTDPALVALCERLHRGRNRLGPQPRRAVELARRAVQHAARLPAELARELALAQSRGLEAWRAAREARDFARFRPALEHMVALKRRVARLSAAGGRDYDALLDEYEPGATMATIDPLLDELVDVTLPLVARVAASRTRVDTSPLRGRFPVDAQRAFATEVVSVMGIDSQRARLDLSTHPFCSGMGPGDVRMTGRFDPRDLRPGLFGVIHEAGHGLYEQGLDPARARTPLGGAVSMALHESQSRLWENLVARSRPFWSHWLPRLKRHFPGQRKLRAEAVWLAANSMRPTHIRVEADELTYNLHIVLRYRIERDLIEGRLAVADLPARWNEDSRQLLGLTVRHDAEGCLQDIHWAMGLFGYFPTYSLGNLYAAQFMAAARRDIRGLDGRIARGNLGTLREWLVDRIHRHDQLHEADKLVRRVTRRPLGVDDFARHISERVTEVYGR